MIPYEVRFIGAAGGLGDLLADRSSIEGFVSRMRGPWYRREKGGGLHRVISSDRYTASVDRFEQSAGQNLPAAAGALVEDLLDPLADGAIGWIEHTPETIRVGTELGHVLPAARWVNVVRDGRDVATSVVAKAWGPDDPVEAVYWWARRVWRGARSVSNLGARAHSLRLESLTGRHGSEALEAVIRHVGLETTPQEHAYLAAAVTTSSSNEGRWRQHPDAESIDRAYSAARAWLALDADARGIDSLLGDPVSPEGHRRELRSIERFVAAADRSDAKRLRRLDRRA